MERTIPTMPNGLSDLIARVKIRANDGSNRLSKREAELLDYLGSNPDRVITRDELLTNVWKLDPSCTGTRTIDMHVANLRRKIKSSSGLSNLFQTIRGQGYMFVSPRVISFPSTPVPPTPVPVPNNN